jgi:hypothetical protein
MSTQQFVNYDNSVALTAEPEKVNRDALSTLKAPCCDDNTTYEC